MNPAPFMSAQRVRLKPNRLSHRFRRDLAGSGERERGDKADDTYV